jgi:hypothetical protein
VHLQGQGHDAAGTGPESAASNAVTPGGGAVADFDGDGDSDIGFYRASTGVWVIRNQPWVHFPAQPEDVLMPADYNGDGTTDIAFYRPSSTGIWVIRNQPWVHFPADAADVLLPRAGVLRLRVVPYPPRVLRQPSPTRGGGATGSAERLPSESGRPAQPFGETSWPGASVTRTCGQLVLAFVARNKS